MYTIHWSSPYRSIVDINAASQQTQNIFITFVQCLTNVENRRRWVDVVQNVIKMSCVC